VPYNVSKSKTGNKKIIVYLLILEQGAPCSGGS
jgi:hypothetical protein